MKKTIEKRKIEYLLHFTKYSNLESIMTHGLIRRSQLEVRNLPYSFNDEKRLDGHPNSISLSISFPNYRMFYPVRKVNRNDTWVILVFGPEILTNKRCSFYPKNAATTCYRGLPAAFFSGEEALESMFADLDGKKRADLNIPESYTTDPQAEVLVFDDIRPDEIGLIVAQSDEQKGEIISRFPRFGARKVGCIPQFFQPRKDWESWS